MIKAIVILVVLSTVTQLCACESEITIHLPEPTSPDPLPIDGDEIPLLPLDRVMIIESMIALDFIQFPETSVLTVSSGGPREVVAKFIDGPNQLISRNYQKPFVYVVIPNAQGNVTLKMIKDGHHVGDKIETQVLQTGESPRPPPGPGPEPKPPEPQPVKSFRVIFVKESGSTLSPGQTAIPGAKAIRDYLNAKTTQENGVPDWREYDRDQNTTNEHSGLKSLWAAVKPKIESVPCLIVEVNGTATVMEYPADVDAAMKILTEAGGK